MYIFVDNQPWSNPGIRSAHLWQIVVTNVVTRCLYLFDERYDEVTFISLFFFLQYRRSPFANKGREEKKKQSQEDEEEEEEKEKKPKENNKKTDNLKKWFSLIDATTFSKKKLPAKKLDETFYGFIVFEVEWANVRGISYLNELQALLLALVLCFGLTFLCFHSFLL